MKKRSIPQSIALSVIPVVLIALASAYFTKVGDPWYQTQVKPFFTPAQWVFPIAWGIVYFCIMVALYLLLRQGFPYATALLAPLLGIGALNIAWTGVFFCIHALVAAALLLAVLLGLLVYVILYLYPRHKAAAFLLAPHLVWGTFALILNIGFILCNPGM